MRLGRVAKGKRNHGRYPEYQFKIIAEELF